MAKYLIVDDAQTIWRALEAKSIAEAVEQSFDDDTESDGLTFDVYRIADGPKRVSIQHETVRKVVIE